MTLRSLRCQVAKVSQFPLFIADTIRANFKLSNVDSSDAELEEVCRRTGLWEVLENAAGPEVYPLDYVLPRTSGEGLSGGQRRLLAVTRALLLHPAILLLDEPTTGIDALGVAQLAPVLREACQGLTVLLVDHDMEFILILPTGSAAWNTAGSKRSGPRKSWQEGRDYSRNCWKRPKKPLPEELARGTGIIWGKEFPP